MATTISFVRHGEVENKKGIFYGRLPRFGLSLLGQEQIIAAAKDLSNVNFSIIYSSPLLRTRQTAKIIARNLPFVKIKYSGLLLEPFTPYEACSRSELESKNWDIYTGTNPPYEQPLDVLNRVITFVSRICRKYPQQHIVVATHGDLICFLTSWVLERPIKIFEKGDFFPSNGSISTFNFNEDLNQKKIVDYSQPLMST